MTERSKAHEAIRKVCEDSGLIDFVYLGVMIDNIGLSGFVCGSEKEERSNVARVERIIGQLEVLKYQLSKGLVENSEDEADEI